MSDEEKQQFLEHLLQYWILSVKDKKWKDEKERRYVIFLYDEYDYREIETDDTFLKIKTPLFLTPDFIMGNNPVRPIIKSQLEAKRRAFSHREYLLCEECLNQDYDAVAGERIGECPVCKSKNVRRVSVNLQ